MHQSNPLSNYVRKPEIFVKLPSNGKWWNPNSIKMPENEEFPIYPMTGNDDLMLRNADALINGSTTIDVIQSCCPNIINGWDMPIIDVDFLFVAIRIASYGRAMEIENTCSECNEKSEYDIDLSYILENYKIPSYDTPVQIGDLVFMFKPPTYKINNLLSQEIFEQQRVMATATNKDLNLENKQAIIEQSIKILTDISVKRIIEYIESITTGNGDIVTDKQFINEFIRQTDRKVYQTLSKEVDQRAGNKCIPKIPIQCNSCKKEQLIEIEFDPANFFEADS